MIYKHMRDLKGTFRNHFSKPDLTGLGRPLKISNVTAINTHTEAYTQRHIHSYMRFILFN